MLAPLIHRPRLSEITAAFRVQPLPDVVDYLGANIALPEAMARRNPGRYSTAGRRYQRFILDDWHPASGINQCDVAAGTQLFKTTLGCLGLAYRLKHHPHPAMIMGPTARWTETQIGKLRLAPLIERNSVLADEKPENSDHFTNSLMQMRTMPILLTGANSPTAIAGFTGGIVWVEEAAKIKQISSEDAPDAHPIANAFERTKDFRDIDYFHYMSCTPTMPTHPFWVSIEEGSQTRIHVQCPHCREYFPFDFPGPDEVEAYGQLIGKSLPKSYKAITWDSAARDTSGAWNKEKVAATARIICPHNGCEITEEQRLVMLDTEEEQHHNPFARRNHRSYIIPSLYSPRISIADMALEFLKCQSDLIISLEAFYNSWLARTWEVTKKDAVSYTHLRAHET